jgi:hypothetical protein
MPGRPNSVCGSCGWSARRRRRRHDRSERKRPRSAAIRPTRNAPEMAYAATASPPSSNFPRADLRVTHTHTDAFAARQRHPPLPRLKMPASFNATR